MPTGLWSENVAAGSLTKPDESKSNSESNPYLIYTPEEFAYVCRLTKSQSSYYYKLMNDIDLSEHYWDVKDDTEFRGYIDGDNHCVSGLIGNCLFYKIDSLRHGSAYTHLKNLEISNATIKKCNGCNEDPYSYSSVLVEYITSTTIYNIYIHDSTVVSDSQRVGTIAPYGHGANAYLVGIDIENVTLKSTSEGACIGGIYGSAAGTNSWGWMIYCNVDVTIHCPNYHGTIVGGLVGDDSHNSSDIDECTSSLTVYASNKRIICGGLVGLSGCPGDNKDTDIHTSVVNKLKIYNGIQKNYNYSEDQNTTDLSQLNCIGIFIGLRHTDSGTSYLYGNKSECTPIYPIGARYYNSHYTRYYVFATNEETGYYRFSGGIFDFNDYANDHNVYSNKLKVKNSVYVSRLIQDHMSYNDGRTTIEIGKEVTVINDKVYCYTNHIKSLGDYYPIRILLYHDTESGEDFYVYSRPQNKTLKIPLNPSSTSSGELFKISKALGVYNRGNPSMGTTESMGYFKSGYTIPVEGTYDYEYSNKYGSKSPITIYKNGKWTPVKDINIYKNSSWKPINNISIRKNNSWT